LGASKNPPRVILPQKPLANIRILQILVHTWEIPQLLVNQTHQEGPNTSKQTVATGQIFFPKISF
jgi:hypothetical protein